LFHSAPGDRTLLVGVRRNQADLDRKPFAADKACRNTRFDDMLEEPAENVTVAEPLVARARECRMIRDLVFDGKPAEPAIGDSLAHHDTVPAPSR
jgi:hypothetical protein